MATYIVQDDVSAEGLQRVLDVACDGDVLLVSPTFEWPEGAWGAPGVTYTMLTVNPMAKKKGGRGGKKGC